MLLSSKKLTNDFNPPCSNWMLHVEIEAILYSLKRLPDVNWDWGSSQQPVIVQHQATTNISLGTLKGHLNYCHITLLVHMGTSIFHMHSSLGHFLSRISYERVVWTCKCLKDRCHGAQWNLHSVNDLRPLTLAKTWKLERNVITSKYFPIDHGCFIFQHWAWWLCEISKGITLLVHTMELSRLRPSDRPTSDIYLIQQNWVPYLI